MSFGTTVFYYSKDDIFAMTRCLQAHNWSIASLIEVGNDWQVGLVPEDRHLIPLFVRNAEKIIKTAHSGNAFGNEADDWVREAMTSPGEPQ